MYTEYLNKVKNLTEQQILEEIAIISDIPQKIININFMGGLSYVLSHVSSTIYYGENTIDTEVRTKLTIIYILKDLIQLNTFRAKCPGTCYYDIQQHQAKIDAEYARSRLRLINMKIISQDNSNDTILCSVKKSSDRG